MPYHDAKRSRKDCDDDDPKRMLLKRLRNAGAERLQYEPDLVKNDIEIILPLVKFDWRFLEHASDNLRDNCEVVATAVEKCGTALQYASNRLKSDGEMVAVALKEIACTIPNDSTYCSFFKYDQKQLRECNELVDGCLKQFTFKMDIYLYSFLAGFSQAKSKLQVLGMKLGKYHGALIKKKIGEYIGLQHGLLYSLASETRSELIHYREEFEIMEEIDRALEDSFFNQF
jgi:hypothetical protein